MTIREISKQLHQLSHGIINGEHFTIRELERTISMWMRGSKRYICEITLADSSWLFSIDRFADAADGYDYYIPDTREQEERLWEALR